LRNFNKQRLILTKFRINNKSSIGNNVPSFSWIYLRKQYT